MPLFKILSIDGGGVRGAYAATLLAQIEHNLNKPLLDSIDMLAGTSTGSIISTALAAGIPASKIVDVYRQHGAKIFSKRFLNRWGLIRSTYDKGYFYTVLSEMFGDRRLGDLAKPVIIPATNIAQGSTYIFDSHEPDSKDVLVRDAVAASCSAPILFKPEKVQSFLLADGGMWANNPSLIAVRDAIKHHNVRLEDIRILSIGTGIGTNYYRINKTDKAWGVIDWDPKKLMSIIVNLQSMAVDYSIDAILQPAQYLRLNFESDSILPLDAVDQIPEIEERARQDLPHYQQSVMEFFHTRGTSNNILD